MDSGESEEEKDRGDDSEEEEKNPEGWSSDSCSISHSESDRDGDVCSDSDIGSSGVSGTGDRDLEDDVGDDRGSTAGAVRDAAWCAGLRAARREDDRSRQCEERAKELIMMCKMQEIEVRRLMEQMDRDEFMNNRGMDECNRAVSAVGQIEECVGVWQRG